MKLPRTSPSQRGAAALAITMVLLFVMALGATFVNRNLVFEQRSSANQYRSTQAFEAAEAGLEWAEAQLGSNQAIDADCLPSAGSSASFRERHLALEPASGSLLPRDGHSGSRTSPLQPGCVVSPTGWSCGCPADGPAALLRPAGAMPAPSFTVQFLPAGRPGVVRAVATGCSNAGVPCVAGAATADATARVEVLLGLLGGVRRAPAAALTTAGGTDPDRFFASWFGLDKAQWQAQPVVTRVTCRIDCAAVLAQAVRERAGSALIWVDGGLDLAGPVALGSADRPVVIVVDGGARLSGAVAVTGALYAGSVEWTDAGAGASVRGALLVERAFAGSAAADLSFDAPVLGLLAGFAGSFARVAGSWRDF